MNIAKLFIFRSFIANMDSCNNNSLAFKSNIKFVSPLYFLHKVKQTKKHPMHENITHWNILPTRNGKKYFGYRENISYGYTRGVKSCTAGVFARNNSDAPLFIHIENTRDNCKNTSILENLIDGSNAILVGSKDEFTFSTLLIEKINKITKKKKIPTTLMQGLNYYWEANLLYEAPNDTLYLCVNNIRKPLEYINNNKTLHNIFKTVSISKTDNIEYFSKIKETYLLIKDLFEEFKQKYKIMTKND